MCLYVKEGDSVLRTEHPVMVTKFLMPRGHSPFKGFKYKKRRRYDLNSDLGFDRKVFVEDSRYRLVYEGFHSYPQYHTELPKHFGTSRHKLCLFIIPAHTQYVQGKDNGLPILANVSSSIIYIGRDNKLNRWIARKFYKAKTDF